MLMFAPCRKCRGTGRCCPSITTCSGTCADCGGSGTVQTTGIPHRCPGCLCGPEDDEALLIRPGCLGHHGRCNCPPESYISWLRKYGRVD